MVINHNSKIPLYLQLKDWIINQIETNKYQVGEKIPSELELASMHNISRPTVRQAIEEIVKEGLLIKRKGKGTFVFSTVDKVANKFSTFAEDMKLVGVEYSAKLVLAEETQASEKEAIELDIPKGSSLYRIVRVRLAKGIPLVIRESLIPASVYPDLLKEDLEENIYDFFAERGIFPSHSKPFFQAVQAEAYEAKLLEVQVGTPLLLWEGLVYDKLNRAIEKGRVHYLGSKFRFQIEQTASSFVHLI